LRPLGDRLEREPRLSLGGELLVDLNNHCLYVCIIHVAAKLGLNTARMHRRRTHAALAMASVKGNGKQNVRGLGAAVRGERFVGGTPEIRIIEVDVGEAMSRRGKVHQSGTVAHQRRYPVDQQIAFANDPSIKYLGPASYRYSLPTGGTEATTFGIRLATGK
jgi:hypothetical protein